MAASAVTSRVVEARAGHAHRVGQVVSQLAGLLEVVAPSPQHVHPLCTVQVAVIVKCDLVFATHDGREDRMRFRGIDCQTANHSMGMEWLAVIGQGCRNGLIYA